MKMYLLKRDLKTIIQIVGILITFVALGVIFYLKAMQNYTQQNYTDSNFFKIWLAGHMMWTGENPYNSAQWLGEHNAFGARWQPNEAFLYPLPLALFIAPLGLLTVGQAYFAWQIVSQTIIALVALWLILHWQEHAQRILFPPLMIFLLFFGPIYLTLQVGSVGPLALAAIALAILLLEHNQPIWAGMMLSLTMLKPPQGLTILILVSIWFLVRHCWKAILGIAIGGTLLLIIGIARDPLWPVKFRSSSFSALNLSLGANSNVFSFAYLACNQIVPCMWIAGTVVAILILTTGGCYLWYYREQLKAWEAFNIIIPLGFISTIYLWSYDQLTYTIPIIWIVGTFVEQTRSYIYSFVFLIVLDTLSMYSLLVQASTHKDLFSLVNTILVLGMCLWLWHRKNQSPSLENVISRGP
jgi:hypothetical protein